MRSGASHTVARCQLADPSCDDAALRSPITSIGFSLRQSDSDPEQDYFADGMVETSHCAVSFQALFVIARNSSLHSSVDVGRARVGCASVEGSVRKSPRVGSRDSSSIPPPGTSLGDRF